jgi:hypothetical protein
VRWLLLLLVLSSVAPGATDYYVDCSAGNDSANGLSPETGWRSVAFVNEVKLLAGDRVLLKRGTVCKGVLAPQGSGVPGQPISIIAYGAGALPVVDADGGYVAIRMNNQEYWTISQVAATGSTQYGIFIGATTRVMHSIRLQDVQAWGVHARCGTAPRCGRKRGSALKVWKTGKRKGKTPAAG